MNKIFEKGFLALQWDLSGKFIVSFIGFITTIFLARMLEPIDFGMITMVMAIISIAQIFSDMGLSGALIQRSIITEKHFSSVFWFNMVIGLGLSILVFTFSELISQFYDNQHLVSITQIISVIFIINAFGIAGTARLRRDLNYKLLAKISVKASLISSIIAIIFAYSNFGVWSLASQVIFYAIAYNFLICLNWTPSLSFSYVRLKELWSFGFRMFLSNMIDAVYNRAEFIIIGNLFFAATLGFFQRARQLSDLIIRFPSSSLASVLFPLLAKVQKKTKLLRLVLLSSLNIFSFFIFLLIGFFYIVSSDLIIFLFSSKWEFSVTYIQLLILSGFGQPISALLVSIINSRGNAKAFLKLEIWKKTLLAFGFIPLFTHGIETYLMCLIGLMYLCVFLNIIFVANELNMSSFSLLKPVLVQSFLSSSSLYIAHNTVELEIAYIPDIFIKIIVFTILFIGLNILFNTDSYSQIKTVVHSYINSIMSRQKNLIPTKKQDN